MRRKSYVEHVSRLGSQNPWVWVDIQIDINHNKKNQGKKDPRKQIHVSPGFEHLLSKPQNTSNKEEEKNIFSLIHFFTFLVNIL